MRKGNAIPSQLKTIFIDKFKRSDHHVYTTRIAGRNGAQIRSELEGNAREKLVITNDKKRLLRCKRNVLKDWWGPGKVLSRFIPEMEGTERTMFLRRGLSSPPLFCMPLTDSSVLPVFFFGNY